MIKNNMLRFLMGGVSMAAIVAKGIDQLPGAMIKKPLSWYSPEQRSRLFATAGGRGHAKHDTMLAVLENEYGL